MSKTSYTIGELAKLAGVTTRTIRYYISEGLLPPPQPGGPSARYDDDHLRRLELIRRLQKDESMTLARIRASLEKLDRAAVQELTSASRAPADALRSPADTRTAQEYLSALLHPADAASPRLRDIVARRAQGLGTPGAQASSPPSPAQRQEPGAAAEQLPKLVCEQEATPPARALGGAWQRYVWHPDIEVQVRLLPEDPRLRKRLSAFLQALRELIASFASDEQEAR